MKKILCFVLAAMLMISCMAVVSATETISLAESLRFEFEDYADMHVSSVEPNASGSGVVGHTYSNNARPEIAIPVTVSESGYYDVSCVVNDAASNLNWVSTVEFYLDDLFLGDNAHGYTENLSAVYPNLWTATPVVKTEYPATWIDAGDYDLKVVIHNTGGEAAQNKVTYKYMMDYIEFAPTDSFVKYEFGTLESVITYSQNTNGIALLALYNNNELVTVQTAILTNQRQASFSIPVDVPITHAKSFLWEDYDSVKPLEKSTIREINRDLYTLKAENVFMIDSDVGEEGDSSTNVTNSPDSPCRQFPFLWQFGDTLIASWSQHTDTYENAPYDAIMISRDGGKTWGEKQIKQNFYLTSICQLADGTLFGVNYWTHSIDNRTATVHYWTSDDLGATWTEHAGTIHHENDISTNSGGWASIVMHRGMRQLPDGRLQGLGYGKYVGDTSYRCVVVESADGGENWYVTATVASGTPLDENGDKLTASVEGFCEPVMQECLDGTLLCVMRIASNYPLYQSRSTDGGKTWSVPEILPGTEQGISVDPDLCLMDNGVLVLSTGRPDSKMLISLDGSGYLWQEDAMLLYGGSTGYTGVCQVGKDRVLVIGDNGAAWHGVTAGTTYGIWGNFVNIERRTSYAPYLDQAYLSVQKKTMSLGDTQKLSLSAFDNDGRKLTEGVSVSYSADSNAVEISADGTITAKTGGTVHVTATVTAKGITVTSNVVTLKIADMKKLESVSVPAVSQTIALGKTLQIAAKALNLNGEELTDDSIQTSYTSSSNAVATVSESGLVTGISAGTVTITVTMTQGDTVKSASVTVVVFGGNGNTLTFENDTVGKAPANVGYHPNEASVSVSDSQAANGSKSVYLNDTATNSMTCLRINDTTPSSVRVVDFKLYPVNMNTSMCLKLYRDNNFNQQSYSFNLSFSADGAVKSYSNSAWSEVLPAGTVKNNEWNTIRVITNAAAKTVTITANGVSGTASNISYSVGNTYGVEFHTGSTYTAGCKFYLDDISVARNLNILTNSGFEAGTEGWVGDGATLIPETSEVCTGSASLKIEKTGIYGHAYQKVSVTPGKTYQGSAWIKLGEGNAQSICLSIHFKQDGKDMYQNLYMQKQTPGDWTKISGSITIPDGISEVDVYLQLFANDNSTGALTQDFYVDDIIFEPAN